MGASVRTPEIEKEIVERLSKGEPLAQICRGEHMPCVATVRLWREADEAFASSIARAREDGFDAIAADCFDIADDVDEDPASRRVRTDVRLKLLAKWDPKRYGDLIKHAGPDGTTPAAVMVSFVKTDAPDAG